MENEIGGRLACTTRKTAEDDDEAFYRGSMNNFGPTIRTRTIRGITLKRCEEARLARNAESI